MTDKTFYWISAIAWALALPIIYSSIELFVIIVFSIYVGRKLGDFYD